MDELAQEIGNVVIALALMSGWFWALLKAADRGHNWLAWIIGLGPFMIVVLGFAGFFR